MEDCNIELVDSCLPYKLGIPFSLLNLAVEFLIKIPNLIMIV